MKKIIVSILLAAALLVILVIFLKCGVQAPAGKPAGRQSASISPASIAPEKAFVRGEPGAMTGGAREDYDVFIVRTDSSGKVLWKKTLGASKYDWADFVIQAKDGGFILLGRTYDSAEGIDDCYIYKLDHQGNTLWSKNLSSNNTPVEKQVAQSVPGGYIIAGTTESDGVEVYLARTDEAGNYIWTHNYGREYHEWGSFTYLEEDGSYFTVGQSAGPDVTADFYLSKKGSKGEPLWSRTYGGEAYDWAYSMEKAGAGFVLAGLTYSFGAGNDDIYIVKTDAEGGLEWQKQYGGSGYDEAFSISAAGEGFILAGSTSSWGALNHDGLLMLVDSSGNSVWSRTFGGSGNEAFYSAAATTDGGFIAAGVTNSEN